jgi:hypothetical protein
VSRAYKAYKVFKDLASYGEALGTPQPHIT